MKYLKITSNKTEKIIKRGNRYSILLKIFSKKGKLIDRVGSHKSKRIFNFIEAGDFKDCVFDLSVKYSSGGSNRGVYKSKRELRFALKAFLEE
jgi:hypothetical protein